MPDLLETVRDFLSYNLADCNAAEIVPCIELYSPELSFPRIGIMDGGDLEEEGASETLSKETVFVVVYEQIVGDREQAVLKVRKMIAEAKKLFRKSEYFHNGQPFEEFVLCKYKNSQNAKTLTENGKDFIIIKAAVFEFHRHETFLE